MSQRTEEYKTMMDAGGLAHGLETADMVYHLRAALKRIATPEAFYVATSNVDPEAFARMVYAQAILDDHTLESAAAKAEYETRQRYPLSTK